MPKTIVISGGTDGMGRATALARLDRGDTVVVIGSNAAKGQALTEHARAGERLQFIHADLSSIADNLRVIAEITRRHRMVDALVLCANRPQRKRVETADGLESTFALYYLSRYLLSYGLRSVLDAAPDPVIVSVAGVGTTAGSVLWDDLHLQRRYSVIRAQLHAGRATDLLGVAYPERSGGRARFVMYHPGFTRSGDVSTLGPLNRVLIRLMARIAARPVERAIGPILEFIDHPPRQAMTAVDQGRLLDLTLPTLDPHAARRLADLTEALLADRGVDPRRLLAGDVPDSSTLPDASDDATPDPTSD